MEWRSGELRSLPCRLGARCSVVVLSVCVRVPVVAMPLIAARAPPDSSEAHLRRTVAGFFCLLPIVHTIGSARAQLGELLGAIGGIPAREAGALRTHLPCSDGNS